MVRFDLEAARRTWITEVDVPAERRRREESDCLVHADIDGRVFDFHCRRGQFVANLEAAGVSPKMLQTLARHSDIKTTLKHYARVQLADTQAALGNLPPLPSPVLGQDRQPMAATDADGESLRRGWCFLRAYDEGG